MVCGQRIGQHRMDGCRRARPAAISSSTAESTRPYELGGRTVGVKVGQGLLLVDDLVQGHIDERVEVDRPLDDMPQAALEGPTAVGEGGPAVR